MMFVLKHYQYRQTKVTMFGYIDEVYLIIMRYVVMQTYDVVLANVIISQ